MKPDKPTCEICFCEHETDTCKVIGNIAIIFSSGGAVSRKSIIYLGEETRYKCKQKLLEAVGLVETRDSDTDNFNKRSDYLVTWARDNYPHIPSKLVIKHTRRLMHDE
jgi:hypothetical protein